MSKIQSSRKTQLFVLGALLGAAVFLLVYGIAPLDVANDAFCRGGYVEKDIQQHYAGWLFYRDSALRWPLGVSPAVNAPSGLSVAYTDSIPRWPHSAAVPFSISAGLHFSAFCCRAALVRCSAVCLRQGRQLRWPVPCCLQQAPF